MRILVTGAAGFIGSNMVRALLRRGDEVLGIDSLTDYYDPELKRANLATVRSRDFTFAELDLETADLDSFGTRGVDAVIHLAGQPGVRKSWGREFSRYTRANVDATQRLLESCRNWAGLRRFVYASSSSVYGQADVYPTTEDVLPRPFSPYGVTKLAGEHLAGLYRENFGLPTTSFRFFTVYGPAQRPDMAFSRFLSAATSGAPIQVYGTGEQIRDFTFVEDIVAALILAVDATGDLPRVMNLSGGSSVSVNDVLRTLEEVVARPLVVERRATVDGDVFRTGGDSELALEALGWKPVVGLADGLKRQLRWSTVAPTLS